MAGHRFCGHCGAALSPEEGPPPERAVRDEGDRGEHKPVTILFCDIVNSTAMAERQGSEAAHRILDRFFGIAVEEVERYGGTVNKFLGDGLLALVGVPQAHEDHARRAVLVALGLRQRLRDEWPVDELGPPPQTRMGIDTGTVLVGTVGGEHHADHTAVGDTANVAARLQELAEPGEILVSEATARLVGAYARLEPVGALALRGKSASVTAHRLVGVGPRRSPLDGLTERSLTPFVGRDVELARLLEALAAARAGHGQALNVLAEPGLGKSRLLFEFRRSLGRERVTFLEGRCLSFGAATPYLPVLDIVRANAGIEPGDPAEAITAKVQLALAEVGMDADRGSPFLLHLLGVPASADLLGDLSPEAVRAGVFETLRSMCLQGSRRRPLVLAVEDLHWIDATSEATFRSLAEALADAPILLLGTHRPGYRPPWDDLAWTTQVILRPLGPAESRTVVRAVIGPRAAETALEGAILGRGEGNPFFLEELARSAGDRGDLEAGVEVPETVQGVLMARIDRLPREPRRVLQTASVLGREFSPRLLGTIWHGGGELDHHLAQLRRLEFLYERPGETETLWVFKHALTQDVAYGSLLSGRRRELHAAAARSLEALAGERPEEVQELLAMHYSQARVHDKAVEHLGAVAAHSFRRHAHEEAARALELALEHADHLGPEARDAQAIELTLRLADSLYFLGRFAESGERLERVRSRVEAHDDVSLGSRYHFAAALVSSHAGSTGDAVRSARTAKDLATRCGDDRTTGKAEYVLCRETFWHSRLDESIAHGDRGAALLGRAGDLWWEGQCRCFLNLAFCHAGDLDAALESIARGRAIGEAMGDMRLQSYSGWNIALVEATRLDTDLAIAEATRSLEISPDPLNTAFASGSLGFALVEHGDPEAAIPWLERSTQMLYKFGVLRTAGWMHGYLADARLRMGALDEARTEALGALETTLVTGHRWGTGRALRTLGVAAHRARDLAEARDRLTESVATFVDFGGRLEAAIARLDLARLARAEGRREEVALQLRLARTALDGVSAPRWRERLEHFAAEVA